MTSIRCDGQLISGTIPSEIRQAFTNFSTNMPNTTRAWVLGESLCKYLYAELPQPEPIDIGTENNIVGTNGKVSVIEAQPGKIRMLRFIEYTNGHEQRVWYEWKSAELPKIVTDLVDEIDSEVSSYMREHFLTTYGDGKVDPEKWRLEKKTIFVSYRGNSREIAEELVKGLGEYGNQAFFLPHIDFLDMQAGNWLDQLMKMIETCDVFMPILTNDYLDGPIARPELDAALRGHFQDRQKRIIPILVEGEPKDYNSHFIGGFHMVQAQDGMDNSKIEEIAYLALELSRNPYK